MQITPCTESLKLSILLTTVSGCLSKKRLKSLADGRFSTILKKVRLPMVSNEQCQQNMRRTRLGSFFTLHKSFVCAGGEEESTHAGGTAAAHWPVQITESTRWPASPPGASAAAPRTCRESTPVSKQASTLSDSTPAANSSGRAINPGVKGDAEVCPGVDFLVSWAGTHLNSS